MKIKKNDTVIVIAGKDKGKKGKVISIDRKKNRLIVEGVNEIKKHQKPNHINHAGGIITKEAPIDASNVMYLHNGSPTRLGYKIENIDGKRVKKRIAKKTGEIID